MKRPSKYILRMALAVLSTLALGSAASFAQHGALLIATSVSDNRSDNARLGSDIDELQAALAASDYDVSLSFNASMPDLKQTIVDFFQQTAEYESRIVYVTGQNISVDGENYLLPADAVSAVGTPLELSIKAVSLNPIVAQMGLDDAPSLLVLDLNYAHAIDRTLQRNGLTNASNILALRSIPASLNVLTATNKLNIARRNGDNDFPNVLADALTAQGTDIIDVMNQVASNTKRQSRNRQEPTVHEGSKRFFLGGETIPAYSDTEFQIYQLAVQNGSRNSLESFLNLFPNSVLGDDVRQRIDALTPQEALIAINQDYLVVRRANLRANPGTNFSRIGRVEANELLYVIGRVQGSNWLKIRTPDGTNAYIFDSLVTPYIGSEMQVWRDAQRNDNIAAYQDYLARFPNGEFVGASVSRINALTSAAQAQALAPYRITPMVGQLYILRNANIRDLPDTSGNRIGSLAKGSIVPMSGRSQVVDWYQIDDQGRTAFVWGQLATPYEGSVYQGWNTAQSENSLTAYRDFISQWPGSAFEAQARANIEQLMTRLVQTSPIDPRNIRPAVYRLLDDVSVRARTNNRGRFLANLSQGEIVQVVSISNDLSWVQISGDFGTGWFTSTALVDDPVLGTPAANVSRAASILFEVALRYQPGYNNPGIRTIKPGENVLYNQTTQDGLWAKVVNQPEGDVWVPISAVKPQNPAVFIGENVLTRSIQFRGIDTDFGYSVNVRQTQPVIGTLEAGELVNVQTILANGNWVIALGTRLGDGWIPRNAIRRASDVDRGNLVEPISRKLIATSELSTYQNANLTGRVGRMPVGATIVVTGAVSNANVYQINNGDGTVAYIASTNTTPYEGSSKQAYDRAIQSGSVSALRQFLQNHPNSFFREQAIEELDRIISEEGIQFNLGGINLTVR